MSRLPPVATLSLAFAAGAAAILLRGASLPAPVLLLLLAPPIGASLRPGRLTILLAAGSAGLLTGALAIHASARCPRATPGPVALVGRFVAAPAGGSGLAPFATEDGWACPEERVWAGDAPPPGERVRLEGERRAGRGRGTVVAHRIAASPGEGGAPRAALVRWRARLVDRVHALYGPRGPTVAALVLARREGLDPGLRDAFARAGTAHLLAISGFHVGVLAALALAVLRAAGARRETAGVGAAAATWGYVALLGFPDAATRAALILTLVVAARLRGRPPARWGALGAAFLLLVASDPRRLASVGFQLSFAGAAGLVAWAGPVGRWLARGPGRAVPSGVRSAVAAGVAATAATVPVVAWHFERVSVVGIPATLASTPLVAVALPGAVASLVFDPVFPAGAAFLAGGVDLLLGVLETGTRAVAELPWASVWTPRSWVAAAGVAAGSALVAGRLARLGAASRRWVAAALAASAVVAWPALVAWGGRGTLEILAIDVGQGDAIAVRSPRGRWSLVDAGPPAPERRPDPVVSALARRGVAALDVLVLTHPHLDHIGGAAAVLDAFDVGAVLDPAVAAPSEPYVGVLEAAAARGVAWIPAREGMRWVVDGVELEVLYPPREPTGAPGVLPPDLNDVSVVVLVRFGSFEALLTGDAPTAVERALAGLPPALEVLKVAHHGSDTSTDSLLLARTGARVAVVSVGRGNRYGHPSPRVLGRLERAGVEVRRTDREGTLRIVARPDGRFVVSGSR